MYKLVVKKSQNILCLYLGCRLLHEYPCAHAGGNTGEWKKEVARFGQGHTDPGLHPNAWFSFGVTFDPGVYQWPEAQSTGPVVNVASTDPREHWVVAETAERTSGASARILVDGKWQDVWADGNPFGAAAIEIPDTSVLIHGSPRDRNGVECPIGTEGIGADWQPRWSALYQQMGCVRVENSVIMHLKDIVSVGSPVTIAA